MVLNPLGHLLLAPLIFKSLEISFCVNNSIAVDWIRILWSNKVYFFDNYISSNCFICNISAKIAKVICE